MLRFRCGLILLAGLVSVAQVSGEETPEQLPPPRPEMIQRDDPQGPVADHIFAPDAYLQLQPTPRPILSPGAEYGGLNSDRGLVPTIASVHEFDRPPLAYMPGDAVRIGGTRFEVDVSGLDPAAQYRLLACFDGETIGETDWFIGRESYSIPTQVGFPPGRYRLTVQAFQRDASGNAVQIPPVLVNYQPTYLRKMNDLVGGRDVTAVTSHRAISHRRLDDDLGSAQIQVRFVGLDKWNVHMYRASTNQFDSETLVVHGRKSFVQGHKYQLKFAHGDDKLYPTLEIPRTPPQATVFLAQNSVPVELTGAEVEYVTNGGLLTKVMYLPHCAEHPTRANCVETLVGRCPGECTDPTAEAARNGTILAILRLGDKDLEQMPAARAMTTSNNLIPLPQLSPTANDR